MLFVSSLFSFTEFIKIYLMTSVINVQRFLQENKQLWPVYYLFCWKNCTTDHYYSVFKKRKMSVQSGISSQSGRLLEQTDFLVNVPGVLDSIVEKENATWVAAESRPKVRKSCREKRTTQKKMELLEQEAEKTKGKFTVAYGKWKACVKEFRTKLKCECSENDIMDVTQRFESEVEEMYSR